MTRILPQRFVIRQQNDSWGVEPHEGSDGYTTTQRGIVVHPVEHEGQKAYAHFNLQNGALYITDGPDSASKRIAGSKGGALLAAAQRGPFSETMRENLRRLVKNVTQNTDVDSFGSSGAASGLYLPKMMVNEKLWVKERAQAAFAWLEKQGLKPEITEFFFRDPDGVLALAAYTGFDTQIPNWKHGRDYEQLKRSANKGSKIYELVTNERPCRAVLSRDNRPVINKLVMIHVGGHTDFFRNNKYFSVTDRHIGSKMQSARQRVLEYEHKYGRETVQAFVDACYCLENLIDPMKPYRGKDPKGIFDDESDKFPAKPQQDVLGFLLEGTSHRREPGFKLEPWQRDILEHIRSTSYYFAPQAMTKIMNEGWASLWHQRGMASEGWVGSGEAHHFCACNAGVMMNTPSNVYRLGVELFHDIEDRWNRGMFGAEWEEASPLERKNWGNKKVGRGHEKILEVRENYRDLDFISDFLTPDACARRGIFTHTITEDGTIQQLGMAIHPESGVMRDPQSGQPYILPEKKIKGQGFGFHPLDFNQQKQGLMSQLVNCGSPVIRAVDGNYEGRGELLLEHQHEGGKELLIKEIENVLAALYMVWKRPVHIRTQIDGEERLFSYPKANQEQSSREGRR